MSIMPENIHEGDKEELYYEKKKGRWELDKNMVCGNAFKKHLVVKRSHIPASPDTLMKVEEHTEMLCN